MVFTRTCKALSRREMWGLPGTSLPPGGVACMRIETQAFTVFMCVCVGFLCGIQSTPHTVVWELLWSASFAPNNTQEQNGKNVCPTSH